MALPSHTSTLRRIIVGVALLGIVVVTHLALQKANGFANGCTGLGDVDFAAGASTTGTTAGCAAVTESEYADFLGISNIALGLIFYVVVAVLRLGYAVVRDDRLRLASGAVTTVGFLYTGYLVYLQAAVIGSFCPLCMTSAAIVTVLFALHLLEHRRLGMPTSPTRVTRRRDAPEPQGVQALRPYAAVLGGFAVLLASTFGLAARADNAGANGPVAVEGVAPTPPPRIQDVTGACTYDPAFEPISDLTPFTSGPYLGNGDAEVVVVKVFDPNCPHCRSLSETLDTVIEENGDAARYHFVPYPLRQQSLGQVVALKLAASEGRFFDLMNEMFKRQDATWGMSMPELVETVNTIGMDGEAFEALLNDQERVQPYLEQIQAEADAVNEAFATASGGISVPKLAINGNVVEPTYASYSARCLSRFIAEAQ